MKRIAFGALWFVVFVVAGFIVLGIVAAPDTSDHAYADQAFEAGYEAGYAQGERWGKFITGGALLLSVAGTFLGWLPGTRRTDTRRR